MDPFAILGIEATFEVDLRELERRHRELSRAVHPDRHGSEPPSVRNEALGRSVEINEALRVVRDPVRRAEALLARLGVRTAEGRAKPLSQTFLMEMLERREALDDAKAARDGERVRALGEEMAVVARAAEAALGQALAAASASPSDAVVLAAAEARLGELRFFRRFAEEVGLIEEMLDDGAPVARRLP